MAGIAGGALAAAVTRAGGLGLIGGGYGDVSWIDEQLDIAADAAVGVGLITWALRFRPGLVERLVHRGVRWVWLSFGDDAPHIAVVHQAGAVALCQVQSVAEARRVAAGAPAAGGAGADVIVAQGQESGGHGRPAALRANLDVARRDYRHAVATDDTDGRVVWAGTGVARIHDVLPAGDIVKAVMERILGTRDSCDPPRPLAPNRCCGGSLPHG